MAQRREDLRAADKDREFVAEHLRTALNEGRLTLGEYDERLQQAYAARTYGELDGILDDLPGVTPIQASQVVPLDPAQPATQPAAAGRPGVPGWLWPIWGSWVTTTIIVMVIWIASGGTEHYFWPIWVFGPWGAVLLARTLGALAGRQPQSLDERHRKHREWREDERQRRRAERERRRAGF